MYNGDVIKNLKTYLLKGIPFIAIFTIGVMLGMRDVPNNAISPPVEVRENSSEYSLINPLLFSRVSKKFYVEEFRTFNDLISQTIQSNIDNQKAEEISIYFRDLNTGHWTGINEDTRYRPSSMLKVLAMMSYFRNAESIPNFLSQEFYYTGEKDPKQYYEPTHTLSPGFHSIDQLIEQMIVYSDNSVLDIFAKEDSNSIYNEAYQTLQLPLVDIEDINGFMSPRSYSATFRTLYNATYLSRTLSEKALKLLTKTDFKKGLVQGLPKNIIVAHKFGENTYDVSDKKMSNRELHDCGIIYYPQHPYLLCIMTKGFDFPDLEKVISGLSKIVYDYVDKKVKN